MNEAVTPPGAGGIPPRYTGGRALLASGFWTQPEEAAFRVVLSLQQSTESALKRHSAAWKELQAGFLPLDEKLNPNQLKRFPADLNRWDSQRVKDRQILAH